MTEKYDLIIVGAGFVGLTLAFAFSQQGRRVALVEAKDFMQKQQQQATDGRALALSRKSVQILSDLNIWPHLADTTPINQVKVSAQGRFGKLYLSDETKGALGYVVAAPQLGAQLLALCQQQKNITWFCPAVVENITQDAHTITAHLKEGSVSAALLIVAEGTQSLTRMQQDFSSWSRDYQQKAITANISLNAAQSQVAYLRLTTQGTLALLPLKETQRFTLVWTVNEDMQYEELSDNDFLTAVQPLLGAQLGQLDQLGPRKVYHLNALFVEKAFAGRLLLMGNAAHTLNPIAAQGLNLTLRDIACLLELFVGKEFNTVSVETLLAQYQAHRLPDQKNMLRFTDGLVNVLSNSCTGPFRGAGLFALNHLPFVKHRLFEHLLGY